MSGLYLRMKPENFNEEATKRARIFTWEDYNNNNFLEEGELVFDQGISDLARSYYVRDDGSFTEALYKTVVDIDAAVFLQHRFVYHLILDKGIDGNPHNNIPIEDCFEFPPLDENSEQCVQLVRNSVELDDAELTSGKSQGGDLHGLIELFPRLAELGIHTVYSTSYLRQSRTVGAEYSPVAHGYNPADLGPCSLSPFLADQTMNDCDFIKYVYEEAAKNGISYVVDYPFMGTQPFDDGVFNEGLTMMDTQYVFRNGEMIADANLERAQLGLKYGEFDENWRETDRPNFFFSHAGDVNFSTTSLSVDPSDFDYYWKLQTHTFFGLRRPNLKSGSLACETYSNYFWEHPAKDLFGGFRGDAFHYASDQSCVRDIVASSRQNSDQDVHISAECMGAGEVYDYSKRCAKSYLLNGDPDKRVEVFFFGARTAMEKTFINDRVSLDPISWVPDVYKQFKYDPRIMTGYLMFPDNHDKPMLMDLTSEQEPLRRMTYMDMASVYLFAGASPASIYVYYPTLAMVRDRNEMHLRASIMGHRPKLDLQTSEDEKTFNMMERTVRFIYQFSDKHHRALGYGSYEPGLREGFDNDSVLPWKDTTVHAVRRKFFDDEVGVVVLRSLDGDARPEDELRGVRLNLTAGRWRDAVTGQEFDINHDGTVKFVISAGIEQTTGLHVSFNEQGYKSYYHGTYCNPGIYGAKMCYDVADASADLPDGRWMAVNPLKDSLCDPYSVYENYYSTTSGNRYSPYHPYEGCPTYVTKNGYLKTVNVADSKESKVALRSVDGSYTLPDGQYFLDRDVSGCSAWVDVNDTEGRHEAEVCGSIQDEIVWVKNGRVRMIPQTRVLYLEKIAQ